ncbi:MAG: hypothetical protein V3S03_08385 [Vicinamibacteria bacterium]
MLRDEEDTGAQALGLVGDLCGIPDEIVDTLSLADAFLAVSIAGDLIEKQYAAARLRAKELGIDIGPAPIVIEALEDEDAEGAPPKSPPIESEPGTISSEA